MRDGNFAEAQLTIVLVHPNRLFTEGLASLLKGTHYNIVHQLTGFDSPYYPGDELEGKVVFVVGGRNPSETVEIIKSIRSHLRSAYILVISASTRPNDVLVTLEAGADGYLRDVVSSQTFVRVMELIVEHETILPSEFVKSLRKPRMLHPMQCVTWIIPLRIGTKALRRMCEILPRFSFRRGNDQF
jgi:DNA-binding NarL/FixJ family response regulator